MHVDGWVIHGPSRRPQGAWRRDNVVEAGLAIFAVCDFQAQRDSLRL